MSRTGKSWLVAGGWVVVPLVGCMQPVGPDGNRNPSPERLDETAQSVLARCGWSERVGDGLGLWASIARQRLYGLRRGRVDFVYFCSTAANGAGQEEGSFCTPLGWHEIADKIGTGLPTGAVLRDRQFTGEIWSPGDDEGRDRILTRILWLRGLEPGRNAGPGLDSYERYIYIHGTSAESRLGAPASYGCIRLSNADVKRLFDEVGVGTRVLITAD
jgi:L,D-transpeptidase YbiS